MTKQPRLKKTEREMANEEDASQVDQNSQEQAEEPLATPIVSTLLSSSRLMPSIPGGLGLGSKLGTSKLGSNAAEPSSSSSSSSRKTKKMIIAFDSDDDDQEQKEDKDKKPLDSPTDLFPPSPKEIQEDVMADSDKQANVKKPKSGKFLPNVHVKRAKQSSADSSDPFQLDQDLSFPPSVAPRGRGRGRGRGRAREEEMMVASGPFAMGPAAQRAAGRGARSVKATDFMTPSGPFGSGPASHSGGSSLMSRRELADDLSQVIQVDLKEGETLDDFDPFSKLDTLLDETKSRSVSVEAQDAMDIDARLVDEKQSGFDDQDPWVPVKLGGSKSMQHFYTSKVKTENESSDNHVLSNLGDPESRNILFFQFPATLPALGDHQHGASLEKNDDVEMMDVDALDSSSLRIKTDPDVRPGSSSSSPAGKASDAATLTPFSPMSTSSTIKNALKAGDWGNSDIEGLVGKLVIYTSGKIKLKMGDFVYDVSSAAPPNFLTCLAAIDTTSNPSVSSPVSATVATPTTPATPKPQSIENPILKTIGRDYPDQKRCYFLGNVSRRFVCTPNIDALLE